MLGRMERGIHEALPGDRAVDAGAVFGRTSRWAVVVVATAVSTCVLDVFATRLGRFVGRVAWCR